MTTVDDRTVAKNVVDRVFADLPARVPLNVHAEWSVGGPADPDRVRLAAAATMREHPLLNARHGADQSWRLPSDLPLPVVEAYRVDGDDAMSELRGRLVSRPFDLNQEAPVRFAVVGHPAGDRVVAVADHALVDGVGIGRTITSLMAHHRSGPTVEVDRSWRDAHRLAVGAPSEERIRRTVRRLHERALPTAVRLAREQVNPTSVADGYGVAYHDLSAVATGLLRSRSSGTRTHNDLVVAAFCAAGMAWNRQRGAAHLPFSVGVPLNLRPARTWFDGVCNATLPWPVRIEDDDPAALVQQVADQLRPVRAGLYSTDVRALLCAAARQQSLSVRMRHCLATTTVVSTVPGAHVARVDDAPAGVSPPRLHGGAPAPPSMGMTFAVVPDQGTYRFSARFLLSRHSPSGASRFLTSVDEAIVQLCQHEVEEAR